MEFELRDCHPSACTHLAQPSSMAMTVLHTHRYSLITDMIIADSCDIVELLGRSVWSSWPRRCGDPGHVYVELRHGYVYAELLVTSVWSFWSRLCGAPGHVCVELLVTSVWSFWSRLCGAPGHVCVELLVTSVKLLAVDLLLVRLYRARGHICLALLAISMCKFWLQV